jgi:hypothetical protein
LPLLAEIKAERTEIAGMIADGIDQATLDTVLSALLRMRATLCAEARGRRSDPARDESTVEERVKEVA